MYGESSKVYQRGNDDSDESEDVELPIDDDESSESDSDNSDYSCHICGAHSSNLAELRQHIKSEHSKRGGRTYKCRFCGEIFENKTDRLVHHALHRDRRYECSFCEISFAYEKSLEQHESQIHSDMRWVIKPFICGYCNHSFKRRSRMNSHLLRCARKYDDKNKKKSSKK